MGDREREEGRELFMYFVCTRNVDRWYIHLARGKIFPVARGGKICWQCVCVNRHTATAAVDESTLDKHNSMEKRMRKTQTEAFIVKSNSMLVYRHRVCGHKPIDYHAKRRYSTFCKCSNIESMR